MQHLIKNISKLTKISTLTVSATALILASTSSMAGNYSPHFTAMVDNFWSDTSTHQRYCKYLIGYPSILMPNCMKADNVRERMVQLQNIADDNGGNRAAGLPGYSASVDYVASELESMGYDVSYDSFDFNAYYENSDGMLSSLAPDVASFAWDVDFTYMSQTESGDVTALVEAVDLDLGLGNASSSGCEFSDFAGFTAGNIALVQRGACSFQAKAENAAAAGAVGAIIFNQGSTEDRMDLINGTLGSGYSGGIPVFFATYENGELWASTVGLTLNMVADVLREIRTVDNVIAESRWGNPNNVVMLGSHLDSVFGGPGINDNGSGSAAILEIADLMKYSRTRNKVRFAWWGAEEAGLVGSTEYVQRLSAEELAKIKVYLNFDMIGSPNFFNSIYDGDGSDFGLEGPVGSAATEALFEKHFNMRGEAFEGSEISFRSDYAEFFNQGVPFGGLFTGAEGIKTEEQAALYGGTAGDQFDPCYHSACDTIDNMSYRALEVNADAAVYVTSVLARSTRVIDDEIAAAAVAPETMSIMSFSVSTEAAYDIDHWGQHWIK